jgi:hypothetical protein
MTAVETPAAAPPDTPSTHRGRRITAAALAVISALVLTLGTTGVWLRATTMHTDRWVDTVGPLGRDARVQAALAQFVGDELVAVINLQDFLDNVLPDRAASALAGPLTNSVENFITDKAQEFFESEAFENLWVDANRVVHQKVVAVLRGDSEAVNVTDGKVQLDLVPVVLYVLKAIDEQVDGFLSNHIPALSQNLTGDEARARLSDALNRDIPDDFGVITVFEDSELSEVQAAVQLAQRLVIVIVVVSLLLMLAAVLIATDRRRIAIWIAMSTAVSLVLCRSIARAAGKHVVDGVEDQINRAAVQAVINDVIGSYLLVTAGLLALSLVVAAVAFVAGPSRAAVTMRGLAQRPQWLRDNAPWVQGAIALIAILVLLFVDLTILSVIAVAVLVGAIEVALWRLHRSGSTPLAV